MGETFVDSYNKVLNDPLLKDYVVEVLIANSPEGTYELNKQLNFERRVAVTKYLEEIGVPLEKCNFDVRVEDWDQLANLIAASDLKNAAKMAEMVKGYDGGDSDSFEQKFSATFLSEYSSVRRELYPELRRAFIKIIPEYEEDVAVSCHYCIASDISNPDSEAMESRLFTKYQVRDILNFNNNLVNAYGAADYKKAAAYADQIPYDYANEFVRSNKALAYLRVGRYAEARAILERNTIEDVQYNYALACLLEGDYQTANKAFEGYVDTNVAVAKMALGQYPQAESVLIILPDGTNNKKELLEIIGSK
ncbi:MAG: tetratricopeptide repeat protein [Bacteroidales bacterium]|nr:tetratricopeptide repeat protein [Bacteroidales bacterium]